MKLTLLSAIILLSLVVNANAEQDIVSDGNIDQDKTLILEPNFLPGIKPCNDRQIEQGRLNCQEESIVREISTQPDEIEPTPFVQDDVVPNGNILRIDFNRKKKEPTRQALPPPEAGTE